MSPHKGYMNIAIAAMLFVAAFAGVAFIADEDVAAEGETQEYTVTYSYDGFITTEKTSGGKLSITGFGQALASAKAPNGYEFAYWTAGSAIYEVGKEYSFAADVTLEPVFKADRAIIKLVYGDEVYEHIADKSAVEASKVEDAAYTEGGIFTQSLTATFGPLADISETDLAKFAKLIGAVPKTVKTGDSEIKYTITGFDMTGFEFKGFVKVGEKDAQPSVDFSKLVANATVERTGTGESAYTYTLQTAEVNTYMAVFEPVYDVSFIVEGAQVDKVASNEIVANESNVVSGCPVALVKENYIFMGWYNAAGEKVIGYSVDKNEYNFVAGKDFKFTESVTLYAHFVPLTYTVTFVYGEDAKVFETETVKYGEKAIEPKALPAGYKGWDFDFKNPILADTTIVAIEADPVTVYNVVFEIEGKAPITQKSDSMVLPDTTREGYVFQGWLVKGETGYVDPMKYDIQSDITFVAVYKTADPPAGPGFFETNEGKCVAVIIGVALLAFIYAVYTNMFGMKDFLTSIKIQRVKKE